MSPRRTLDAIFGCDLRSFAALRIGMALLVVADLIDRSFDLTAHYTDLGVMPRPALIEKWSTLDTISFHFMNGSKQFMIGMFVLQALCALLLLIGWRTRLMTVVNWVLLLSLQARNPMVLQAGDALLRLLFFWSLFLPLGARWSVDRFYRFKGLDAPQGSPRYLSLGSAVLLLQVCSVYWFAVLLKSGHEWWPDGTAVYYALHVDTLATRLGIWLRQYGSVLHALTLGSLAAEGALGFALLAPVGWLRFLAVLCGIGMHISFSLFMELGNFPWIDFVSLLPFVPTPVWDAFERRATAWTGEGGAAHGKWQELKRRVSLATDELVGRWGTEAGTVFSLSFAEHVAVGLCFATAMIWNLSTVERAHLTMPPRLIEFGNLLRLDQQWAMFAPFPMKDDGWYVIEGTLRDKSIIDVRSLEERSAPNYEEPEVYSATFRTQRWRKYMMNLWAVSNQEHRLYYARYLCRQWNNVYGGSQALEEFHIYYMRHETRPDYQPRQVNKVDVWHHFCFH